jgi:hypothetical protein
MVDAPGISTDKCVVISLAVAIYFNAGKILFEKKSRTFYLIVW